MSRYIVDNLISKANKQNGVNITPDDTVLYFNGFSPMMKSVPILAYPLMFGVNTAKELEQPIMVTYTFVQKRKQQTGEAFFGRI